jgi:hypothetical protein
MGWSKATLVMRLTQAVISSCVNLQVNIPWSVGLQKKNQQQQQQQNV